MKPNLIDLQKCIHCGLCLQACPTFIETGQEAESPRGRIYLMRAALEGRLEWKQAAPHLDLCLGCLGCQTACPSGVPYTRLIESARSQVEADARSPLQRSVRRHMIASFTNPHRLRFLLGIGKTLGMKRSPRFLSRLMGIEGSSVADLPVLPAERWRPQTIYPARGERKCRAGLLLGCAMQVLFPQVHRATVEVLTRNGVEVVVPPVQSCCGALWAHNGYPEKARQLARRQLRTFRDVDYVIVNAAGCGSTMKEYPAFFDGSDQSEAVRSFANKVKDVSELLWEVGFEPPQQDYAVRATYHDACHLVHGQGIRNQPRELLRSIPGLTLIEMDGSDLCCGSAGVYNLLQPEMAKQRLKRKVDAILAVEPDVVVSANAGCTLWIRQGLKEADKPIPVLHPFELLANTGYVE